MTDNMTDNKDRAFKVRPCSKKELALMYFPHMDDPRAAVRVLMRMVNNCRPLMAELEKIGYAKRVKTLTSKEVETIIAHIGEP